MFTKTLLILPIPEFLFLFRIQNILQSGTKLMIKIVQYNCLTKQKALNFELSMTVRLMQDLAAEMNSNHWRNGGRDKLRAAI